jgi:hypothetical protein
MGYSKGEISVCFKERVDSPEKDGVEYKIVQVRQANDSKDKEEDKIDLMKAWSPYGIPKDEIDDEEEQEDNMKIGDIVNVRRYEGGYYKGKIAYMTEGWSYSRKTGAVLQWKDLPSVAYIKAVHGPEITGLMPSQLIDLKGEWYEKSAEFHGRYEII